MKKSFLFSFLVLSVLCLSVSISSCKATKEVYTAFAGNGVQLVFIRPVDFKQVNPIIKNASLDITMHIVKQTFERNPVCNYTLTLSKSDIDVADEIEVAFVWLDDGELRQISALSKELLFRDLVKNKANVRFSLEFDKDEFAQMMGSDSPVRVLFVTPEIYNVRVENEEFNKQIDDVRLMMKL